MSRIFRCAETKLLFRFEVKFVYSYITLPHIFISEFNNKKKTLEKMKMKSPCMQPFYVRSRHLKKSLLILYNISVGCPSGTRAG